MSDLWEDEGLGAGGAPPTDDDGDDWDEGDASLEPGLEVGFDDPDELEDESFDEEEG